MLVISYLGDTYKFEKNEETEPQTMFRDRCWWIVKNIRNQENISLNELISLSQIWVSMKYHKTLYQDDVMKLINNLNNVYSSK